MRISIIGSGNIGGAIARGLAKGTMFKASDITCTAQSDETLEKMRKIDPDFILTHDNVEAARNADIIIIAVKPWRVEMIIDEIKSVLDFEKQIIVSVAAGVTFDLLNTYLTKNTDFDCLATPTIFRIMPNTAIEVMSSMTFVSAHPKSPMRGCADWSAGILGLRELARAKSVSNRNIVVVMGDLNSSTDHPSFRALLKSGFKDASLIQAAGPNLTFPSWLKWPRIELDHVLFTPGLKPSGVKSFEVEGTDHLALTATLALR